MRRTVIAFSVLLGSKVLVAQQDHTARLWHDKERKVHYLPEGTDFVCADPHLRFNRALYGTNTAFRVEAGDLPEFAMYMPGMGGNLQFGLKRGASQKCLIRADSIRTTYRPGSMIYEIRDTILGKGMLRITILALSRAEGLVVQLQGRDLPAGLQLLWIYGGASGKKFSRDGDIGADPESSFYLKKENCADNSYQLAGDQFILNYGTGKILTEEERYEIQNKPASELKGEIPAKAKRITGIFPAASLVKLADPSNLEDSNIPTDPPRSHPCIRGWLTWKGKDEYFMLFNSETPVARSPAEEFAEAERARQQLAGRIKINTPDPFLNTLGGALSVAADGIWEEPTYLHGAVAWRMRLPGWRGPYVADPLGWHDRARMHFDAYARSQLTTPPGTGVVMDTALNLARHQEKVGTQLFSEGYITRNPNGYTGAHHYDMNLGFIDQLLNHFNYTGDTAYVKKMWPLLKRHLAWEKKNFDADGDGLYDAYAAIWASDALQYSGGGVTHSSAYTYRANKVAAELAKRIGEDGSAYEKEADNIFKAMNRELWMPGRGWYAEYKDLLGNKLLHPAAGLWTIYHAIDSKVPDPLQAYQCLRYIDKYIPHIPVIAKGWNETDLYLLSETNWQPYTWSLNNVVFAENLHTALAYWQGNRPDEAFRLWRSAVLETMYLSAGPGNFEQLSFYDAIRGELYRDFADGIGMLGRSLVEGLFGIQPNGLENEILIQPGFPETWDHASLQTPDIRFSFQRKPGVVSYQVTRDHFSGRRIRLIIPAKGERPGSVLLNGKPVSWKPVNERVGGPAIEILLPPGKNQQLTIRWKGPPPRPYYYFHDQKPGEWFRINSPDLRVLDIFDPQGLLGPVSRDSFSFAAPLRRSEGGNSFFIKTRWGAYSWWVPVDLAPGGTGMYTGTKRSPRDSMETIRLDAVFNDTVAAIFRNKYLAPRPVSPTLQLPVTGIGNWAYHSLQVQISDSGLRTLAGQRNEFKTSTGIPFRTPGMQAAKNIVYTSLWENYPDSVVIPLEGRAGWGYFLMTGSTNPMQSRMINGMIIVNYTDGSSDKLELRNPENWWPIEQDYYEDGFAFTTDMPKPLRIALQSGREIRADHKYSNIRGFSGFAIDGGAATVIDMRLDGNKELKNLVLKAVANDVVIGLMSLTLER